jgi:hypothetical protein
MGSEDSVPSSPWRFIAAEGDSSKATYSVGKPAVQGLDREAFGCLLSPSDRGESTCDRIEGT